MYKTRSVRPRAVFDVFKYAPARRIMRNEAEGGRDTQQGGDVGVCQIFPRYRHPVGGLQVLSAAKDGRSWRRGRTSLAFSVFSPGLKMRTPPSDRGSMSREESETIHDFGRTCLAAHICPSSCRDSRNSRLL